MVPRKRRGEDEPRNGETCFRVHAKDLLGRVGTLTSKSGSFSTPHMFPVVDPNLPIFQQPFFNTLGVHAIMTNAYLLRRGRQSDSEPPNVHDFLKFNETVATDSGAYQILEYGKVGVSPEEIVRYQERIDTDIGVILDVPTGYRSSRARARWTIEETVRRADKAIAIRTRDDILWTGPIQGGVHLDEVRRSAREMAKRDFAIYALGSPTQLMEAQRFDVLIDMIMATKRNLPPSRPLHLFGAGHPALFPFLIAVGCDLFDSAAYALYARTGRYLTSDGTSELRDMEEFPCLCDACRGTSPRELLKSDRGNMEKRLSYHNLQACFTELRRVRDAIRKGRLWDLLEQRAHTHPAMRRCFARLSQSAKDLEVATPVSKPRGTFYFGKSGDARPEVYRHSLRIKNHVTLTKNMQLLLLPGRWRRPYREDPKYRLLVSKLQDEKTIRIIFYSVPFGPVPLELDETYPIAQTESYEPDDPLLLARKAGQVSRFLRRFTPKMVLLVHDGPLGEAVQKELKTWLRKSSLVTIDGTKPKDLVKRVERKFRESLRRTSSVTIFA